MASSGPGYGAVLFVSALTSALVSCGFAFAVIDGWIPVVAEEVPNLEGFSTDAAAGMLDSRGLRLVHRGERHADAEPGSIVEQQPGAGSRVYRGSEISVVVSSGPDLVEVPNLIGLPLTPATARLANLDLRLAPSRSEGGEGEPGTISRTSPAAGEQVARGTEVYLTVVPAVEMIEVPALEGMATRLARRRLEELGLSVGRVRHGFNDLRPPFIVLQQSPDPGTQVEPGSEIDITVNDE